MSPLYLFPKLSCVEVWGVLRNHFYWGEVWVLVKLCKHIQVDTLEAHCYYNLIGGGK